MRKRICFFILPMMLLLISSCATPKVEIRQETGRKLADPCYTLMDMQGTGIEANFYYAAYKPIKDIDDTTHYTPTFLKLTDENDPINIEEYDKVILTLEVWNPKQIVYEIKETVKIKRSVNPRLEQWGWPLAKSKLKYRYYNLQLPLGPELDEVTYGITLYVQNQEIMRFGDFTYEVHNGRKEVKLEKTSQQF